MQARSGALDELLESGVLEDVGGGTDDIQKELDQVGKDAQVDNELAALKAQLGTGAPPEPDALAAAPLPTARPSPPRSGAPRFSPLAAWARRRSTRATTSASSAPRSSWRKWPAPSIVTCARPAAPGHVLLQHLGPAAGARDRRRRTR